MTAEAILILGTGGNAVDILDTVLAINAAALAPVWEPRGFLDDDPGLRGETIHGIPVVGPLEAAGDYPDCRLVNGIGSPSSFRKKEELIKRTGAEISRFATLVDPRAVVSRFARIGPGTVVLPQAVVAADAEVGAHVIVLPQAVVSHDVKVGDFCCIASAAVMCGGVQLGRGCYVGAGALVRQRVRVGAGALVGMGAVVVEDVAEGSVVAGNPARPLAQKAVGGIGSG